MARTLIPTPAVTLAAGLLLVLCQPVSASVAFATSCDPKLTNAFNQAVTLLHSFEYPESEKRFREILAGDPTCAMAAWGVAMSRWHPLWAPPSARDLEAGRMVLAGINAANLTTREQGFLAAINAFYASADPATHQSRARAYEAAMAGVYARHLDDPEATTFYTLALLATADPKDKNYPNQYKAGSLLGWVAARAPLHPGVLHYTIHSYDYPGLAHLALDAALTYAEAAPDSAHAQHMPSHIFTRLGMWDRSLASNHDSTASAAAYTKTAGLTGHYDEGLHSIDYLMYAMLQTARDAEAEKLLEHLRGIGTTNTENFKVAYTYAASPGRFALEQRRWQAASALNLEPASFDWADFGWARSIHHFSRGIGAARSGQLELALDELEAIRALMVGLPDNTLPYWREEVAVHADAVASWILFAEADPKALELALRAAEREDAVDKHPVTPGEVIPARELYADMLLESGRFEQALGEFQRVLAGAPNRLNGLCGAVASALAMDEKALARGYLDQIRAQTAGVDTNRACVLAARRTDPDLPD